MSSRPSLVQKENFLYQSALKKLHSSNYHASLKFIKQISLEDSTINPEIILSFQGSLEYTIKRWFQAKDTFELLLEKASNENAKKECCLKLIEIYCALYKFDRALEIAKMLDNIKKIGKKEQEREREKDKGEEGEKMEGIEEIEAKKDENLEESNVADVRRKITKNTEFISLYKHILKDFMNRELLLLISLMILRSWDPNRQITCFEDSSTIFNKELRIDMEIDTNVEDTNTFTKGENSSKSKLEENLPNVKTIKSSFSVSSLNRPQDIEIYQEAKNRMYYESLRNLVTEVPEEKVPKSFRELWHLDEESKYLKKYPFEVWEETINSNNEVIELLRKFIENCEIVDVCREKRLVESPTSDSHHESVFHSTWKCTYKNIITVSFEYRSTFHESTMETYFSKYLYLMEGNQKTLIWYDEPFRSVKTFDRQQKYINILKSFLQRHDLSLAPYAEYVYQLFVSMIRERMHAPCVLPGYQNTTSTDKLPDVDILIFDKHLNIKKEIHSKEDFNLWMKLNIKRMNLYNIKYMPGPQMSKPTDTYNLTNWERLCFHEQSHAINVLFKLMKKNCNRIPKHVQELFNEA